MVYWFVALISLSCNGQKADIENKDQGANKEKETVVPKGIWKVDKEFDEHGNLIKYDSIYSWSSSSHLDSLSTLDRDSLIQSFRSRFFTNFSDFNIRGTHGIFTQDTLFGDRFFDDDFFKSDFGKDFMNIDKLRQEMIEKQKKFLEKYKSEYIKPEEEIIYNQG